MTREEIIAEVVGIEGGYSNHPDDRGGRTIYGISEQRWPDMWKDGPPARDKVVPFYIREFWNLLKCDGFNSKKIAGELFEAAVLSGPVTAAGWLQWSYNKLKHPEWRILQVDGIVGPLTHRAVNQMCERYEASLYNLVNCKQGVELAKIEDRNFVRGWLGKRITAMKG